MLGICREIFSELLKKEVDYCHWKSNEHLKEGLDGKTDLDILVAEKHIGKFQNTLITCRCIKVRPQVGSRYPKVEEWVGFDSETGRLIHLHVHFRVVTGTKHLKEYIIPWHDLALQTKVLDETEEVYVMEPNLELIVLYLRIVLKQLREWDRFEISRDYQKEILWLRQRVNPQSVAKLIDMVWKDGKEEFLQILLHEKIEKRDFEKLKILIENQIKPVRRGKLFQNIEIQKIRQWTVRSKYMLEQTWEIVPFTSLKTLYGRGLVIAFIGCDGSGKSSITKEINNWLRWKLDSQNFYFGMGDRYKKPLVFKLSQNRLLPEGVCKFCSLLFYYGISLRGKYMRKLMDCYVNKGGIAICDRYPQTQFKGIYDGPKIQAMKLYENTSFGKFFIKMEEKNIRKVESAKKDCIFKLILPPELAVQRSPGHQIGEVKRKAKITEQLNFSSCDVYEIDATQPYDKELLLIKGIIWDKIVQSQL